MPFQERYKSGNTPWEIHRPDYNLINTVQNTPIAPCNALDIGCGTGNNIIWLQQQGFNAIGVDNNKIAIENARNKAKEAQIDCPLYILDFFNNTIPGAPFDFVFDRGCFHHFLEHKKLNEFAQKTSLLLNKGGFWLTLTGNCDETREGPGPPQLSAGQIINAAEPYFEILSLVSGHFDTDQAIPAKNWICLMKKKKGTM